MTRTRRQDARLSCTRVEAMGLEPNDLRLAKPPLYWTELRVLSTPVRRKLRLRRISRATRRSSGRLSRACPGHGLRTVGNDRGAAPCRWEFLPAPTIELGERPDPCTPPCRVCPMRPLDRGDHLHAAAQQQIMVVRDSVRSPVSGGSAPKERWRRFIALRCKTPITETAAAGDHDIGPQRSGRRTDEPMSSTVGNSRPSHPAAGTPHLKTH